MNPVLDTAIVLEPAAPSGSGRTDGERQVEGLLTRVAGLTVLERMVLTLQRAGMTKVIVVTRGDEEPLKRAVIGNARITACVEWRSAQTLRAEPALMRGGEGPRLVIAEPGVFSRALVEELRLQSVATTNLLLATADGGGERGRRGFGMLVLPDANGLPDILEHDGSLQRLTETAASEGRLKIIDARLSSPRWYYPLRTGDVRYAERLLLQSHKDIDEGLIDTYFNRKLASGFTRWFLKTGWSPNAITMLSLLIGFLAAALFAQGTYLAGLGGALVFQFSAVIDCCDGDVARLTFRESRVGEYLDLIGDNVVHMAIFAAIGWAGSARAGTLTPEALAAAAIVGNALSLWFVIRLKAQRRRKAWTIPNQEARSAFILKHVASRDFTVIVLLFAVFDLLDLFLWLAAFGTNVFWVLIAWASRPALTAVRA
jgi:1L-myo-inositol 1-phosphate cytidylyltransferase / CDP-L-myo-inositol myo-inositolphosphotransferase